MSWLTDLSGNLKKIILMQDKVDRLGTEVRELRADVVDHGNRLIRIETMIELAQGRPPASPKEIDGR